MGRHAGLLPALRVAAAAAAAPPGSLLSVSREEPLPDRPGRGEKSRPRARSQVSFNNGTRRTTAPAAMPRRCPTLKPPVSSTTKTRTMLGSEQEGGRPAGPACVSSTRRAAANYLRAGRPRRSLTARARRRSPAESVTVDAARYVPSSSSNNKRATAPPAPPLHCTTAAADTKSGVGASGVGGRRRASAATVVGCGTSTAARARRWRVLVLGRMVVSAARRANGTQRIVGFDCCVETSLDQQYELVTRAQEHFCPGSPYF